ncbi:MAG: glycerophosphodiester phosphodiesterase family protein [Balneola sp.]
MKKFLRILLGFILIVIVSGFTTYHMMKLPKSASVKNLSNLAISHRGYSSTTPENTLSAIETAFRKGAKAVEIDVGVTSDGEYVLMHDCMIDRTTNGEGRLSKWDSSDLKELKVDILEVADSMDISIPTMFEALEKASALGLMVELDIKQDVDARKFAKILSPYLRENDLYSSVWVASFWPDKLYQIRKTDPQITTAFLRHPNPTDNLLFNLILGSDLTPRFLGVGLTRPHFDIIKSDPGYIQRMNDNDIEVNVWVINTKEEHKWLSDIGHNSFSTDCFGETCAPFVIGGHEHSGLCSD